jgi:hypothetical protein
MVVFHEDMKGLSVMEICSCLYQYAIVAAYIATISGNSPISFTLHTLVPHAFYQPLSLYPRSYKRTGDTQPSPPTAQHTSLFVLLY